MYTKLSITLPRPTCRNALHFITLPVSSDLQRKRLFCAYLENLLPLLLTNIAAVYAWNELPRNIGLAPSTAAFKRLLKTHLF